MRHRLALILSLLFFVGCSQRQDARSAQNEIAWSNEKIDAQRVVKRRLLAADPIERTIEQNLIANDRITSARFAINIPTWPQVDGFSDDAPFFFTCVMTTAESSHAPDAVQILRDTLDAVDLTAQIYQSFDHAGTYAIKGSLQRKNLENPDLSVLNR